MAKWAKKRSQDKGGFDKDILVVGDMNIPSRDRVLFRAVRRYGLMLPEALAKLGKSEAGTNLSRSATHDQILHRASNPDRFTSEAGVVDFYMGDHKPRIPRSIHATNSHSSCLITCRCGSNSTHGSRMSSWTRCWSGLAKTLEMHA